MLDSTTHITRALTELDEPFVRYKILLKIYDRPPDAREIRILRDEIRASILVRTLLAELDSTGQIPLIPNQRWRGGHWILYLLADLASTSDDPSLYSLRDQVCSWLCSPERKEPVYGAIEGNALYYLLFLELDNGGADSLAERLVKSLNKKIGKSPGAFAHTLHALRGLTLHSQVRGAQSSRDAATSLAEHLLAHHLYQRTDGQPISADSAALHYPCYAHCDPLFALKVMREAGHLDDHRCRDALDLLKTKQLPNGTFPAERKHYRIGRFEQGSDSLVDWGGCNKRKTNLHVTCDALAVLHAAGEQF